MNYHIKAQILNMKAITKTFEQSCRMAATKDDGKIDASEKKVLKKISAATRRFIKDLDKLSTSKSHESKS